jgi:uncharacterized protein
MFRRTRRRPATAKIFFATDIHGSDRCFRKFVNAASFYSADFLILGGDITGKTLVPITRARDGYTAQIGGRRYANLDKAGRLEVEQLIRDRGQYPIVGTTEELMRLEEDAERERMFTEVVHTELERWMALADERLHDTGVRCFVTPGNDDFFEIDPLLRRATSVEFVEGQRVTLSDEYDMITTGYANRSPWNSPRELDEAAMADRIRSMCCGLEDLSRVVAVLHPPPRGTLLDQAPRLDAELRPCTKCGEVEMESVGSLAVREFIDDAQPLLGLHGHVHESPGEQRLGRTLCINPGSEYTSGTLRGALVGLAGGRVVSHQLIGG